MKTIFVLFISALCISLNAQVTISGIVKNYNDSVFYIRQTGGFNNFTRAWRDNKVKVFIDKNKNFTVNVPEESIGTWMVNTKKGFQLFNLVQGKNVRIIADFAKEEPFYAIGENADDFNYLAYYNVHERNYYSQQSYLEEKVRNINIDSVLFYRKELALNNINILDTYRNTHKMSEAYYRWLKSFYTYEPYERTKVENLKDENDIDDITVLKIIEKGINDNYAALHTTIYNDIVDFYISYQIKKKQQSFTLSDQFHFVANSNILTGSTKDVYLLRRMIWLIQEPDSVYNSYFKKYNETVHDVKLKQFIIGKRKEYIASLKTSGIDYSKFGSVSEIIKKYKGKVIYIDFWASWCLVCRAEMPNTVILKEKLKGEDIEFLYFGYRDKEYDWLKAKKQMGIEGQHYLLTPKMKKEADELFGIDGIPHYVIIDKEGKIISKKAGKPYEVYEQLKELLKK